MSNRSMPRRACGLVESGSQDQEVWWSNFSAAQQNAFNSTLLVNTQDPSLMAENY